jgi:type I restriction enzyme, S subunit
LSNSALASLPVWIPEREEQDCAAEVIRTVDEVIACTEELVSKLERMRRGLLHDLLTRGIGENGELRNPLRHPEQFIQGPLGTVPKNWELSFVEAQFDITSGITLGPHRRPRMHPWPYLRVANVYRERLSLDDIALIEATPTELQGRALEKGDLLVVEGHGVLGQMAPRSRRALRVSKSR